MNYPAEASVQHDQNDAPSWPTPPNLISRRGCGFAAIGLAFAFLMALAIVRTRSMSTEQTSPFWGNQVATAIRLDRPVELLRPTGSTSDKALDFYNPGWIDLTELRDLGYFRRVFLSDENFDWDATQLMQIPPAQPNQWPWAYVRFGQSNPKATPTTIAIHLNEGWVGLPEGSKVTKLNDGMRRRIAYRLRLFAKVAEEPIPPEPEKGGES